MSAAPARAREEELDARVATAMAHVAAVLSAPTSAALPKVADFHTAHREVEDALRSVVDELRDGHPGRADLWSTLIELHQVQRELVEQRLVQRLEPLGLRWDWSHLPAPPRHPRRRS